MTNFVIISTFNVLNEISNHLDVVTVCLNVWYVCCRLRDERSDMERVMAMDKAREGSHNGKIRNGHVIRSRSICNGLNCN